MTETLAGVSPSKAEELLEQPSLAEADADVAAVGGEEPDGAELQAEPSEQELAIARELVRSARSRGVAMTGPGGMLKALTKTVIATALDEEIEHLGYDRDNPAGRGSGNSAIYLKVCDGQVANRPFYAAIGVDLAGHKDVFGLWAGTGGGESAKFWLQVLTELRNRGVGKACFIVCEGLQGLPDSVGVVFPQATVQTCRPPDPQHLQVRLEEVLGPDRCRPETDLPSPQPRRRVGCVRGEVGQALSRDRATVTQRLGTVRALLGLPPRDPRRAVLHPRHRESLNARYRRASPCAGTSRPSRPR